MDEQVLILGGVVAGVWGLLLWLSVVIWAYRDIRDRTRDASLQFLSVFIVLMFFPGFNLPGLALYLLMRPRDTLEEAYARSLEEEALLRELGDEGSCPSCRRLVDKDFQYCPSCKTQLKDECPKCERLLSFSWMACPNCGTTRAGAAPTHEPSPLQDPSQQPAEPGQQPAQAAPASQEVEAARFQH